MMIGLFVISWLPYATVAQLGAAGWQHLVTPYTAEIPIMLAKASYVWNPIVYALSHPRYKAIVLRCMNAGDQSFATTHSSRFKLRQPTQRLPARQDLIVDILQRQGKLPVAP
jgi:hypothetical protein